MPGLICAKCCGIYQETAPPCCRYISGLLAHSKGKSLGKYKDQEKTEEEKEVRLFNMFQIKGCGQIQSHIKGSNRQQGGGGSPQCLGKDKLVSRE